MATKKSTRATRTKSETAAAFADIQDNLSNAPSRSAGEEALLHSKSEATRAAVAKFNLESSLQGLTSIGLGLTKAISTISEDLQNASKVVSELTEAKALLIKDIEDLHGKEVAASAIEDIVADYKSQKEDLQADYDTFQKNLDLARDTQSVNDRDRAVNEARRRDEEAYAYKTKEERARDQVNYSNSMADLRRQNDIKQAELERGWAAKTAEINAKEEEFKNLKLRVDGIQNEIDAAVKKAEAIVANSVKRDLTHQIELANKDFEAQKSILNSQVSSLSSQLSIANSTIAALNAKLTEAQNKVAEIAGNALAAASGRQALAEVQGMLAQQSSNGAKKA
jgi:colicin import membrane protein